MAFKSPFEAVRIASSELRKSLDHFYSKAPGGWTRVLKFLGSSSSYIFLEDRPRPLDNEVNQELLNEMTRYLSGLRREINAIPENKEAAERKKEVLLRHLHHLFSLESFAYNDLITDRLINGVPMKSKVPKSDPRETGGYIDLFLYQFDVIKYIMNKERGEEGVNAGDRIEEDIIRIRYCVEKITHLFNDALEHHCYSDEQRRQLKKTIVDAISSIDTDETPSPYKKMQPGETTHDFIRRQYPHLVDLYRGKFLDGDIISFLRKQYFQLSLVDGEKFTRVTLRHVDRKAYNALSNWIATGNEIPFDLHIPNKSESLKKEIARASDVEMSAVRKLISKTHRDSRAKDDTSMQDDPSPSN